MFVLHTVKAKIINAGCVNELSLVMAVIFSGIRPQVKLGKIYKN